MFLKSETILMNQQNLMNLKNHLYLKFLMFLKSDLILKNPQSHLNLKYH